MMSSTITKTGRVESSAGGRVVRSADGADLGRVMSARGRFVQVESTPTNAFWLRIDDLNPNTDGDLVAHFPAEALAGYLMAEPTKDGQQKAPSSADMIGTAEQTFPADLAGNEESKALIGKPTIALFAAGGLAAALCASALLRRAHN